MAVTNKNWWKNLGHRELVRDLRDSEIPIDAVARRFNKWVRNKSQEPYAAVIREALRAGKNGNRSRHKRVGNKHINSDFYQKVFLRVQKFVLWINYHGKPLAKIIANESIAHRWGDLFISTRKREYERKVIFHYTEAHKIALGRRMWKNVDSSIYWLADTYVKVAIKAGAGGEMHPHWIKKAKRWYCQLHNRQGPRFMQPLHGRKLRQAAKCCKRF